MRIGRPMDLPMRGLGRIAAVLLHIAGRPLGAAGLAIVALAVFGAIFGSWLSPYNPDSIDVMARFAAPSWHHLLGTDQLGRDNFSRMLEGTQIAMTVAFSAISISLLIGVTLGLVAGYAPPWVDQALVVIFDTIRSFPTMIFGIAIVAMVGPSLVTIIAVVTATTFPVYARVVRTQTSALRNDEFIIAERSIGVGAARILLVHILPNILGQLLILASMDAPAVISIEAGLSFLGLGVRPPAASWGTILNDGYSFIRNTPWLVIAGGVPLMLTTIGFTFLGEALRDLLDPKLRKDSR